mgnify:FL=1
MKQVKFRSVLLLLLIVLLGLGLALFCLRYTFRGEAWASFSANGHAYTDGVVRTGQVLDRNGTVLYDGPSGVYHEDSALRQAIRLLSQARLQTALRIKIDNGTLTAEDDTGLEAEIADFLREQEASGPNL